jgi:hypothetical protein
MNIVDLNYMEAVEASGVAGGYGSPSRDFRFNKNVSTTVSSTINFNTNVDFDKTVDVDVDIYSDVFVNGNSATFSGDVEAIGNNSLAELDLSVLTTSELSSISAAAVSAVY